LSSFLEQKIFRVVKKEYPEKRRISDDEKNYKTIEVIAENLTFTEGRKIKNELNSKRNLEETLKIFYMVEKMTKQEVV